MLPVAQPDLSELVGQGAPSSSSLWDNGEWWMLLAAQSMALGTIMVRWVSKYAPLPLPPLGVNMMPGSHIAILFYWAELSSREAHDVLDLPR